MKIRTEPCKGQRVPSQRVGLGAFYCLVRLQDAAKDGAEGHGLRKVQLHLWAGQPTSAARYGTICDTTGCESFLLPPSSALLCLQCQ